MASLKISPKLNGVLQDVIKVIYIKTHALNSRLFEQFYEGMDAEHRRFLLYTEVKWLSRDSSLAKVFELRDPFQRFLSSAFPYTEWIGYISYLCDIFNLLNKLNISLHGKKPHIFKSADTFEAF